MALERITTHEGVVTGVVDNITRAMTRLSDLSTSHHRSSLVLETGDSYVDYQTRMVSEAKEIARISQEMVSII
jgi:talin